MNAFLRIFHRRTSSDAARDLARIRYANERERILATTRQMRRELGLPVPEVLAR